MMRQTDAVRTECEVRQTVAVDTPSEVRQTVAVSLGGKQVASELSASSSGGLGVLLAQCLVYVNVSNRSHKASGFSDLVRWTEQNQHVTCISGSSVRSTKTVCYLFFTAFSATCVKLGVCQLLRDMQCVNLWWTPKAFKGKGQALPQVAMTGVWI